MKNDFEVECEFEFNDGKSYISVTFSQDCDDIFNFKYEIGKDKKVEIRRCIDNFQIYLNDNSITYSKNDLDDLRDVVEKKIEECIKINADNEVDNDFDKSVTINSLHNNDCKFSYNCINKILEKVRNGETKLNPDGKSAPKSLDFINSDGDRCFGFIENIYVFNLHDTAEVYGTEFGRTSFICGFKDSKSKKLIVITLGYMDISKRSPELKYYIFKDVEIFNAQNGLVYLFNIDEGTITTETNCDFADLLIPYHDYYSLCLSELENKNDNQKMNVDLDFLHDYYFELDNLTIDEGSSIIPINGKVYKFKEVQIDCFINNKVEQYPFYGGEVHPLNEEETNEVINQLQEQDISVPNTISFIRFNYSELGDKDQKIIESLIASGKYDRIQIGYNITGDIIRTKRIIDGIEKCLLGEVANENLVELICSNNANNMFNEMIDSIAYCPDEKYINELKNKYWTLKENEEQIRAIDKIVQMDKNNVDLMLVQGPPGTGKTELILSLIKELYCLNYKVLVTSNVQVACDNIVDRLKNFRNIALKRYSTIKGEKYEKEVLENEQKYIKNQVLAGFSLNLENGKKQSLVISNREHYDSLISLKEEYETRVDLIEKEKQKYLDDLKEYNELNDSKNELLNCITSLQEQDSILEESIREGKIKEASVKDNLESQIKSANKLKEKTDANIEKKDQLLFSQQEIESSISDLFKDRDSNNAEKLNITCNLEKLNDDLLTNKEHLSSLNSLIEKIDSVNHLIVSKQLNFYLENGYFDYSDGFPSNFFEDIFSDVIPLIDSGKFIKNVISQDIDFLENGKSMSIKNFDTIYYKVRLNNDYSKIFNSNFLSLMEDIRKYNKAPAYKKFLSFLPFIKIAGKNNKYYLNKINDFNDELKRVYYSFDTLIRDIINKNYNENNLNKKKNKLKTDSENLTKDINQISLSVSECKANIKNIEKELFVIESNIDDKTAKLDKVTKEIEKLATKIEKDDNELSECNTIVKNLERDFEKIATENNENLEKLESCKNELKEKIASAKDMESKINSYYEEKQELIDDFENFMQSKEVAKIRCKKDLSTINDTIQKFDDRVNELINAGWTKDDAENLLFEYVDDVEKISQIKIDRENDELKYCIDGQGTAFREMFELTDTGKGSIISMTTNQVASLLKNTTDDELTFDYAIIDEASKCTFEDIVISLPRVRHLILIGDFMQLDKLYKKFNQIDLKYQNTLSYTLWDSLNKSTFYQFLNVAVENNKKNGLLTFDDNPTVSVMKKQYRMNRGIFNLVKPIYDIHKGFELIDQKQSTFNDVLCIQIDGDEARDDNKSTSNQKEALAIVNILKEISEHREMYPGIQKIGVITGYRAQENFIRKNLKGEKKIQGLEIGTFDRFQGREYDLVLMSMVRTVNLGFTSNLRRMNVAISRAKNHLIILGNFEKLLSVSKRTSFINDDDFETNRDELEFVTKTLIPQLYSLKKKYPSDDAMNKAIIRFLKEEENE